VTGVTVRRIGDLMKDLGFNKDSSVETQKAFIKHLIEAANRASPQIPKEKVETVEPPKAAQLSFDAEILGVASSDHVYRKSKRRT
jgi:hypothetical protein